MWNGGAGINKTSAPREPALMTVRREEEDPREQAQQKGRSTTHFGRSETTVGQREITGANLRKRVREGKVHGQLVCKPKVKEKEYLG